MASSNKYRLAALIFLISFSTHLALISKGPVTIDCLNLALNAQATLATHHLQYQFGTGYPLMVLLGSLFIVLAKGLGTTDPILAVNFIGVLFGSLAVLIFYGLLEALCDELTAMVASFILLLNPIFLDVSTYGINHAPALCFLLLGLRTLLRFQSSQQTFPLLLSALWFGFMGATRVQDLVLVSPAILVMFTGRVRRLLLFILTTALIVVLFHLPYLMDNQASYSAQAQNFLQIGLTQNFQGPFSKLLLKSMNYVLQDFGIVGIFCFGAGLYTMSSGNKRLLVSTILWWLVPFIFYGNTMTSAPRFYTITLPAIIIPISIFLVRVLRNQKWFWKIVATISFLCIVLPPLWQTQQTFVRRHQYSLIADFYRWVGRSTEPDATLISCDDNLFISYYAKRQTLVKPAFVHRHLPRGQLLEFKRKLDALFDHHHPVYITTLVLYDYDDFLEFRNLLLHNYRLIPMGEMPLEFWYETPFKSFISNYGLIKVEKKSNRIALISTLRKTK